jgi:CMP-N-acetylneuraminic acid synthetase
MKKKICALIIARGGSKRIKNKNIVRVNKKPVIYFTLHELRKSKKIKKIFVMTDSLLIKTEVEKLKFKEVEVIGRSKKSSTDSAQSEIAIFEFVNKYQYEFIYFVQLTNIFLKTKDVNNSINIFFKNKYDSMLSVIKSDKFIWRKKNNKISPRNYKLDKRPLKKSLKDSYFLENGSFYIFSSLGFIKNKNIRLFGKIGYYPMGKETYFDIDDLDDLRIASKLIVS